MSTAPVSSPPVSSPPVSRESVGSESDLSESFGPKSAGPVPVLPRIVAFVEDMRRNGVRVSQDETADAGRALAVLGEDALTSRDALAAVLRATLVKGLDDEDVFRRLFALHFHFGDGGPAIITASLVESLMERGLTREQAERISAELESTGGAGAGLAQGDEAAVQEAIHAALERTDLTGLQSSLQVGYFTQRLLLQLGAGELDRLIARATTALHDDEAAARAAGGVLREGLDKLRRLARRAVEREHSKRDLARADRMRARALLDQRFGVLSGEELARMRELVRRLALGLKERMRARTKPMRRGRVDVRQTLRASMAFDGAPMRVRWRRRRRERPDVVVLCDVSDSVRSASLFMLEFLHALASLFRRVRCFVFVDTLGEVTDLFRDATPEAAIERVLSGDPIDVSTSSDYGRALKQFYDSRLDALTRRTTLIVLGDGRSNYRAPEIWALEELRRRARRTLWLCPEERSTWGFGDSEMPQYAMHVDVVEVVRSLHELSGAIDRLVAR